MPALPFIQDTHLAVPDMAPDWTFLESHIEKGNQQYEKGLNEIASNYSAVLNADVTNQGNQVKKAEYLKQFQEGLDKLAGSNLALPQYQADAEKIMAPFWQDSALLTDMSYTKFKKAEISKGSSIQNSKDKDLRDTYSGDSVELMGLQLDNLRTMDRDKVSSSNLDWDTYTADPGIKAVLQAATNNDEFTVSHDIRLTDANGNPNGTIQKIVNGPGSISNYKVYANGIVDEKYNNYFKMLGKLSVERQVSTYKKMGLPREKAIEDIAAPEYKRTLESMDSHITDFDNTIREKSQLLADVMKEVNKNGRADETQAKAIQQLTAEVGSYKDTQKRLKENKATLMTDNGKRGFFLQPEASLAQQHRRDMIDNWAYGQAQNVTTSLLEDKPYWNGQTLKKEWAELTNTVRHQKIEEMQGWQRIGIEQGNLALNQQKLILEHPEAAGPNAGGSLAPGGTFSGYAKAEIQEEDKANAALDEKERTQQAVYGSIYGPTGLSGNLYQSTTDPGKQAEVSKFNDAVDGFTEYMSGHFSGKVTTEVNSKGVRVAKGANDKVVKDYWEVAKFLQNQTGINTSSVQGAHQAMMAYTTKHLDQKDGVGALSKEEAAKYRGMLRPINENIALLEKDASQRKERLVELKKISAGSKINNLINANGTDIISEKDMAQDFPRMVLKSYEDGKEVPITSVEHARMHRNNQLQVQRSGQVVLDGKSYHIQQFGDVARKKGSMFSDNGAADVINATNNWYTNRIMPKYGSAKEMQENVTAIHKAILPGTAFYNKANNSYAGRYSYDLDQAKGVGKVNRDRVRELAQIGNYSEMYVETPGKGGRPVMDPTVTETVRNLINDNNFQKYVGSSFNYDLKGFNGKPMAEIQISSEMPEGAPAEYKALAGKKILIEKDPNAAGTFVGQFPSARDASFHKLNRGEIVTSDPAEDVINKGNFKITPYPSSGPVQSYNITMTKTLFNTKTGKSETRTDRASAAAGTTDPERLEQDVRGILSLHGENYYTAQEQFRKGIK